MIFLVLVYAILQSSFGDAVPTPLIETRDPCSCGESIRTRSLSNIIWSCLSTIFLCTWVSLHPNISSTAETPSLGRFKKWIRRPLVEFMTYKLPLFLWALLVPEYILAWAIRQYIMAVKIQRKVPGWTRAHGFFLIMGGFQLFKRPGQPPQHIDQGKHHNTQDLGSFIRILDVQDVLQYELGTIVPLTSEAEIKDRGKSDGIGKFIVLIQTTWFIIQCIARGVKHLPLTELEIVTLAYSMMNFFVYIFWWDKPRNVGCPIRIYEDLAPNHTVEDHGRGLWQTFATVVFYIVGAQDQFTVLSQERKVPMFWSGGAEDSDSGLMESLRAALGPSVIGVAFGAMHCIVWSYEFPSHTELILWHVSCVAMMAIPLLSTVACAFVFSGEPNTGVLVIYGACVILLGLSSWLYIAARIATIVIAFTTLRSLPSEAFAVVDWTTFIPHI